MSLHEYEIAVLPHVATAESVEQLIQASGLEHIKVMRALQWLASKQLITLDYRTEQVINLDVNGKEYLTKQLPERRLLDALIQQPTTIDKIPNMDRQEIGVAIGILKKRDALTITPHNGTQLLELTQIGKQIQSTQLDTEQLLSQSFPCQLDQLDQKQQTTVQELRSRKQIITVEQRKVPVFSLTQAGKDTLNNISSQSSGIARLTPQLLAEGSWKNKQFRPYDVNMRLPAISGGRRHPLMRVIQIIRSIFVEMGFEEMQGPYVETAFWCMDAMWIPQDHPARDVQDTFYLPYKGDLPDPSLTKKVAATHRSGANSGSKGYGYTWDPQLASQLLLRTHTTAVTYRSLAGLTDKTSPVKRFCVGRVFRNETIDATHLPEFHQVEGYVMAKGLTLRHLMGVIKRFYSRMGIDTIKFKITYNPYTEPSLEALYFDQKRQRWMELINSGVFRPESLAPYGIKQPVIAWGLGVERLAMALYGVESLRELLGATADIEWLRWHRLLQRHTMLNTEVHHGTP